MTGPWKLVEKQNQLFHSSHRPLGISQTARDSHISTARHGHLSSPKSKGRREEDDDRAARE